MRRLSFLTPSLSYSSFLFFVVLCWIIPATSAHAYLDPGSGSMLLQLLLGGIAGLVVIFKLYWARFTEGLKKIFPSKNEP